MKLYSNYHFSEAYRESLIDLMKDPDHVVSPRGMEVRESMNVSFEIDPTSNLYLNEARSSQKKYIAAELIWYFLGSNDSNFISKYAKFWQSIANEDGTSNSAYGNLILSKRNDHGYTQYRWAFESLMRDPDSRQAVMHFNLPEHQYATNKDFVCTMYGIFHIRNNKLNLSVFMRSNDAILGTPTDVAFFTVLQQQMHRHLKAEKYKDLELGKYHHYSNSYHVYDRHYDLIDRMLSSEFKSDSTPFLDSDLISSQGVPNSELLLLENSNIEDPSEFKEWIRSKIVPTNV